MTRDDTKMLQAIIDGQKGLENRLSEKIDKVDKKVDKGFEEVNKRFEEVNKRLDMQGSQLACLEDDLPAIAALKRWQAGAPTIKEFNQLKRKVVKLESVVYKQI